ncbi:hypothetical protein FNF27_07400 [Cafeteria roenbergensis]|uniref:Armadillo repeat-containing domain-containing protein n=2 Tax=Cafeteria roenbergensis TaxID=33653 RepID=A0A5A8C187_CAFRO|nr:hypothetical protein FNF29_07808 [Cafeteria roenbergensis]KAA0167072.1 hypothetical protein FNF27_07400 [Cafeteria roenbergensis]|eukprot:KAA0146832.1 hypothetical protein FNF29_07808 [Cafeteria roenbergensis]
MDSRRIHQSTFNEAVAENIEEFEMGLEEAIADAKEQLTAEGADLTDLVTDELASSVGDVEGAEALAAAIRAFKHPVNVVKDALALAAASDGDAACYSSAEAVAGAEAALSATVRLFEEASNRDEPSLARAARIVSLRARCASAGVVPLVCRIAGRLAATTDTAATAAADSSEPEAPTASVGGGAPPAPTEPAVGTAAASSAKDGEVSGPARALALRAATATALEEGMHALRRLCYRSDDCRAAVSTAAVDAIAGALAAHAAHPALACAAGRCAGMVATRVEGFKRRLYDLGAATAARELLAARPDDDEAVRASCATLRALTARDDPTAKMAQGFEHAKTLTQDGKTVPLLVASLASTAGLTGLMSPRWALAADLMLALRSLHVNNDSCNALLDAGAIGTVILPTVTAALDAVEAAAAAEAAAAEAAAAEAAAAEAPSADEAGADSETTEPASGAGAVPDGAADARAFQQEPDAQRCVRVGFALLKALTNSDAVKRAMADPALAAGGAGASAGADWSGGGSASAMGLASTAPAMAEATATAVAEAAAARAEAADGDGTAGVPVGMLLMLRALHQCRDSPATADQALAALASSVLRIEDNARFFVASGGPTAVATIMRRHPALAMIQRHGALTLRNTVSWDKTLIEPIVAAGVEPVLRAANAAHPHIAGEAARAALRDLVLD